MKQCYFNFIKNLMFKSYCKLKESNDQINIPVIALLLNNFEIVDEARNFENMHAEQILINRNNIKNKNMLITLEPCPACAFHLLQKGIDKIFFGGFNYQYGALGGKFNLQFNFSKDLNFNKTEIFGGFYKLENETLIKDYFKNLRIVA